MISLGLDDLDKLSNEEQNHFFQEALTKSKDKLLAFSQYLRLLGTQELEATLAELLQLSDDDKSALILDYESNMGRKPLSPLRKEQQQPDYQSDQSPGVDALKRARLGKFDFCPRRR